MPNNSYDAIIVGGGSAGAVLAARLSESSQRRVLLLEAGLVYPPMGYPQQLADRNLMGAATGSDWGYVTEPGFIGHPIAALRGKVLGGSSAVNGAVTLRALPSDFARWAERGLKGWSFDEVLPDYTTLENADGGDDSWHGHSGPLPIHQLRRDEVSPMQRAFIDAAQANGIPATADFNGASPKGVGPYPINVVDGTRVNTGMAYLTDEVRSRPHLEIRGDTLVDRVIFDGTRTTGVQLEDGTRLRAAEVILSAGVYGSPAVLLRSGIGPTSDLRGMGIPVVVDLPVGQRLQDHPYYSNTYAARPERIGEQVPVVGAIAWVASSKASEGELDIHITATHLFDRSKSPTGVGFELAVCIVRPGSIGSLKLASRDPNVAPRIDLNFLHQLEDRQLMLEGIRLARRIAATRPLADLIAYELTPGRAATTEASVQQSMLATVNTYDHPTSSAPMGADDDPTAVVDWLGVVRGVDGLRVVDAAIFPDVPSTAINLTVIMAAEHISRLAYQPSQRSTRSAKATRGAGFRG
jgi:choline dehydrogenase